MTLLQVSGPVRLPFWQTSSLSLLPFALKTLLLFSLSRFFLRLTISVSPIQLDGMINVEQCPRHDLFQWTKAICAKISLTDVTHNTSWNLGFFGRNRKSVWTKLTKWTERCETHDIGAKLKCCKHRWTKLRSQQVVACLWTHFIVADRYGRSLYGLLNSVPIYVIRIKGQDMTYVD